MFNQDIRVTFALDVVGVQGVKNGTPTHLWGAPVFVMMGDVAASFHMLGYVAEKGMHSVNDVGGICRARHFQSSCGAV